MLSAKGKRVGCVGHVLFGAGSAVIGVSVERTPLLYLIKRKERYLALDRVRWERDGLHVEQAKGAWDDDAAKRLGTTWDETVIWLGMPAKTERGVRLGTIRDVEFDTSSGKPGRIGLSGGMTADLALGVRDVPGSLARSFDGEWVVFAAEAAEAEVDGGASAAAGKAVAAAKVAGGRAVEQTVKAAGTAAAAGAAAVKSVVGPRPARKAGAFLRTLKDKVDQAIDDGDDAK